MTALLSIENLTAGYGKQPVLHGVSLEIQPKSVFALIGPNGHGKTTLLRCLSGLIAHKADKFDFGGEDIGAAPSHIRVARGLIHVPQGDLLFRDMSVEENLLMGAYLRNDAGAVQASLADVYKFFPRLGERRAQLANSLSGGEQRMAGIGRGLMAAGQFMMIDEPSLGLAPLIIEQIYDGLKELAKSGRTILIVEENPMRIVEIADHMALMDGGQIVWSGSPAALTTEKKILQTYFGAV